MGYTDADGGAQEHCCVISGYIFIIDGGAVSCHMKKQELVTLSAMEAEYVAVMHTAKETIWLQRILGKLFCISSPLLHSIATPGCLEVATCDNYHTHTKHIDQCYHFIQQIIANGTINFLNCPTEDMLADMQTKALPKWMVAVYANTLSATIGPPFLLFTYCSL